MSEKQIRLSFYRLTIFLLSLGVFYFFDTDRHLHRRYVEKYFLSFISSFFNLFVLYYHCTHAPHPKFLILRQRRFAIYVHIVSGLLEFLSCWFVFFTGYPIVAKFAALVAICGHVPSAYYQTSSHFGAKGLIIPAYFFLIALHLFSAIYLFFDPHSIDWLLNMFLVHNIYAWCRIFYFCFDFVGIFKDSRYTNSILISVFIVLPSVLGILGNMLFLGYITATMVIYGIVVQPNPSERIRFVNEYVRDLLVNRKAHEMWIKDRLRLVNLTENDHLTDQQRAKHVFDQFDENQNGRLDGEEIDVLLRRWDVADSFVKRFKTYSKKNPISFDFFYRNIWRLGQTSVHTIEQRIKREGKAKARFVFDILDSDESGYIDTFELQKLLIQWGLPENEVNAYLANDDDKRFSFDEFYQNLKPLWDFAYENMRICNDEEIPRPHSD